jgi:uroporphyrinogen-III synthase
MGCVVPGSERRRLLITRSEPGASAMAAALAAAGYDPVVCPMIEIEPSASPDSDRLAQMLDTYDVVICLSPAAAEHALPLLRRHWPALPAKQRWIALGGGTARALRRSGISAEAPSDGTSEGVLALPALAASHGLRVLLLCGEGGRTLLAQTLVARGAHVSRLECYRRRPPARSPLRAAGVAPVEVAAIVVSSGEGGDNLARCWHEAGGSRAVPMVVPSERVAAMLRQRGFTRILVAKGASVEAVGAVLTGIPIPTGPARPSARSGCEVGRRNDG